MSAFSSPLVECFREGEAPRDIRLMAACGGLALRPEAQLALLMLLASDEDPDVRAAAEGTIGRIPPEQLAALAATPELSDDLRDFYGGRAAGGGNPPPAVGAADPGAAVFAPESGEPAGPDPGREEDSEPDAPDPPDAEDEEAARLGAAQRLAGLTVAERMKVATRGSREERQVLIRDPNRLVSAAVLSSPKLTESEIEAIARMTSVSADVLRTVGSNRVWLKNYAVLSALTRNAKTPIAVALPLVNRLTERDIKSLSNDRNVPEPVRLAARRIYVHSLDRRQ